MKMFLITALGLLLGTVAALWLGARFVLSGADHRQFDEPQPQFRPSTLLESEAHKRVVVEVSGGLEVKPGDRDGLVRMREFMDQRGAEVSVRSTIIPVTVQGVSGEWVIAPGVDTNRRVLYLHGGGYVMGSALSHRRITDRMSLIANAAVLAVNYSLMPEHTRLAGIEDCRESYRWILENGPDGQSPLHTLIVAGDSAGANLALSVIAWARDSGLPPADAVVALSPPTDATLASPTLVANIESDVMQGKSFGPVVKAPKTLSLWVSFAINRINPSDPIISPLLGDLWGLPPTLLQYSQAEMFAGEVVRYGNKANQQGSLAVIQPWPHMVHVWHAFDVPEADAAFTEIRQFLDIHAPTRQASASRPTMQEG